MVLKDGFWLLECALLQDELKVVDYWTEGMIYMRYSIDSELMSLSWCVYPQLYPQIPSHVICESSMFALSPHMRTDSWIALFSHISKRSTVHCRPPSRRSYPECQALQILKAAEISDARRCQHPLAEMRAAATCMS